MDMMSPRLNRRVDILGPARWEEDLDAGWLPRVDVYDQNGNAVIQAELPGVKKEDIDIDVRGNVLTLKGHRQIDSDVKEGDFYCKERFFGSFQRSFTLPGAIDPESIEANFGNGILKVIVPRPKSMQTRKLEIGP